MTCRQRNPTCNYDDVLRVAGTDLEEIETGRYRNNRSSFSFGFFFLSCFNFILSNVILNNKIGLFVILLGR